MEVKMIKKKCAVCGKEIEVANPQYCLCSDECRKIRNRAYKSKHDYVETHRKYMREERWRNAKVIPCKICGEPVPPTFRENRMYRKHYHEKCVLKEALQAVREGCKFSDKRIVLAWNTYGYTKTELLEELDNYY